MAAQTCVRTQHATLSTTVADTITFSGEGQSITVTNRDGTNTLYFRCDGTTAVAAADETYVVLPNQSRTLTYVAASTPWPTITTSVVANGGGYSVELF